MRQLKQPNIHVLGVSQGEEGTKNFFEKYKVQKLFKFVEDKIELLLNDKRINSSKRHNNNKLLCT